MVTYPDDHATPLMPTEREGLIPTHITLRSELNELEQQNVAAGDRWAFRQKRAVTDARFLKSLHRQMFNRVWRWAGAFRTTERNLGVGPFEIETALRQAIDDARYWVEHRSYEPNEIAVRFHHRLVTVHPFPNGNGRWSRLVADVLVTNLGRNRFTWGGANLQTVSSTRARYIEALQAADRHELDLLLQFARS